MGSDKENNGEAAEKPSAKGSEKKGSNKEDKGEDKAGETNDKVEDAKESPEEGEKPVEEEKKTSEEEKPAEDNAEKDDEPTMQLRIEIRHDDDDQEQASPDTKKRKRDSSDPTEEELLGSDIKETEISDPKIAADMEFIKYTAPTSKLEMLLSEALHRKDFHIERLTGEVQKLKAFISKRKQTYKRKRKDEGAPTRALSAYNIFVQDRFARLAKENEAALKSADSDAQLKRVPPANLVASTGNEWKDLPAEEKAKYEERAKADRKRYEEQMAQYQPPDKQANRKRNKTGYNMFFSAHVLRLKQSEMGVPSERGSVARLVGSAWKQLSAEEKQYYEREADKHNGMNPVEKEGEDEEDDESKRQQQAADPYAHMHPTHEMHMHGGMPPPMHPGMHQSAQHDPRHHGYAPYPPHHMYGQPAHGYYDYGHHSQSRHQHGRSQGYQYPPQQGHPYDQRPMQM